jgi:hypothetical protein
MVAIGNTILLKPLNNMIIMHKSILSRELQTYNLDFFFKSAISAQQSYFCPVNLGADFFKNV